MRTTLVMRAALLAAAVTLAACDSPPSGPALPAYELVWLTPPADSIIEGDSAWADVEIRDTAGVPAVHLDGVEIELRLLFSTDSQPGTACGLACTATIQNGRLRFVVPWIPAGSWTASVCLPVPDGPICEERAIRVRPMHAHVMAYPASGASRRQTFAIQARLELEDGTPVDDRNAPIRLHFSWATPEPAGGRLVCQYPNCELIPVSGYATFHHLMALDTAHSTVQACVVAPNGHERCDARGLREFDVDVATATLRFVTEPSNGTVGEMLPGQPVVEILEPDGTRRTELLAVHLSLGPGAPPDAYVGNGNQSDKRPRGDVARGAAGGLVVFAELRLNRADSSYTLIASADDATSDTSAPFRVRLEPAILSISKSSGDDQIVMAGAVVPDELAVVVTGPLGDSISGVRVVFQDPDPLADFIDLDWTDANGLARTTSWPLGHDVGIQNLRANIEDVATETTFRAHAVNPRRLVFLTDPADFTAGDTMPATLRVEARDSLNRRVTGFDDTVRVAAFALPYDTAAAPLTVVSRPPSGSLVEIDDFTMTRAGEAFLVAWSRHEVARQPLLFVNVTGFTVAPSLDGLRLIKHSGDNQVANPGTDVVPPAVRVEDVYGNTVEGQQIEFNVTGGGGTATGRSQFTNDSGLARPASWTLGPLTGPNTLEALPKDFEALVTFTATAADIPIVFEQLAWVERPADGIAGDLLPPIVIELQDSAGRRAVGADDSIYVFASIDGGGVLLGTTARTPVTGRVTFDDLRIERAGAIHFYARHRVLDTSREISDSLIVSAHRASGQLQIVGGNNETATAGTATEHPPAVRLADRFSNGIAGEVVRFTVAFGGAIDGGVQTTDVNGTARATSWTLGSSPGPNYASAAADNFAGGVAFFATGTAPTFDVASINAAFDFTCAVLGAGSLPHCWGNNASSQLGDGTQTTRALPTEIAGGLLPMTQMSGGSNFACGIVSGGGAVCWGANLYGQLGIDTVDLNQHATPEGVVGGGGFTRIAAGFYHACALDAGGLAWCWGEHSVGQLGIGVDRSGFDAPQRVIGLRSFVRIVAGASHSCGLEAGGAVWCWGSNDYGQLGHNQPTEAFAWEPVRVAGDLVFSDIAAGGSTTCGIASGSVYCWGRNREGQVGNGTTEPGWEFLPVNVLGALGTTRYVAVGTTHGCSLNTVLEMYCWGGNANGQLGDGTATARTTAVRVDGHLFTGITAGHSHTCARKQTGAAWCWGNNTNGRLGLGYTGGGSGYPSPVARP